MNYKQPFIHKGIAQIQLPPAGASSPRPILNGKRLHSGHDYYAMFPGGWAFVTITANSKQVWQISTPGYEHISPIGLFVAI